MTFNRQDNLRKKRALIYYGINICLFAIIFSFLVYTIRAMILPVLFGALFAYMCKPLIDSFKINNSKSILKAFVLTGLIVSAFTFSAYQIKQSLPNKTEKIELKVRLLYKVNEIYKGMFSGSDNYIALWFKKETRDIIDNINLFLSLSSEEKNFFEKQLIDENDKLTSYYYHNLENLSASSRLPANKNEKRLIDKFSFNLSDLYSSFTIWLLMPIVFLFLLFDQGKIRKYFVGFIPNRYFELSLTLIYQVDKAIGRYIRGTFLQCSLVGLTLLSCFILIGFPWKAALFISLLAAAANAIPFLGPFIGLVIGLSYSLILEDVHSVLPFINIDNIYYAVIVSVLFAQTLDNIYFQPFVLGSAINLHPLIVVLGVMAGASFLGWIGMLLAVPTIVVLKVIIETLTYQLKAYKII